MSKFCLDCNGSGVVEDFDGTVDHAVCDGTGYIGEETLDDMDPVELEKALRGILTRVLRQIERPSNA